MPKLVPNAPFGKIYLDSFSGPASDLRGRLRTPENVLAALRKNPRVSAFDMTENCSWLPGCIRSLIEAGAIREVKEPYPWLRYEIVAPQTEQAP